MRQGDRVMLFAVLVSFVGALVLASQQPATGTAVLGTAVLAGVAGVAFFLFGGTLASRLAITAVQVALVALHIQLAAGAIELHFGVFVTLALLLVYQDWRVVVFAAALFAVHHVLFDRLQAAGLPIYCTPEPDFAKVLLHAFYVVVQTGVEVLLCIRMKRLSDEGRELSALVAAMDKSEGVDLDIGRVPIRMPQARKLAVAIGRVNDAVVEVRDATAAMESATSELAGDSERLRDRSARVTDNLEKTASSIEEIAATVTRSRDAARDGHAAALRAADATATGSTLMRDMADRMSGIAQSSQSIGNIVALIDGIAFQTNILALNAAVEAARAGDHGRGFAVVAAEVRSLSQRSALAAREIKTLIDTSSIQVNQGGAIMGDVDQAMAGIGNTVEQTTALMKAIDLAAAEQQAGIDHVNESVAQIESMTQQNAQLATASAASALRMQDQIARLSRAVQAFHSSGTASVESGANFFARVLPA
ncbi:hypothetical protein ASE76_04095 [Xylophilus sp. Leaf220]|nr:hypothetical protein ASE76_04095 [Xylophilus sp. Leaf220]